MTALPIPPTALAPTSNVKRPASSARAPAPLPVWLGVQALNVRRHTDALRPFARGEFGTGDASPSEGHLRATNDLIGKLRANLDVMAKRVNAAAMQAQRQPTPMNLERLVTLKASAHDHVRAVERIWDFYFELFGQRQTRFADMLLACDRVALDCYQTVYVNLGVARSIPAPPPFSYMRTGFSPATYRRGIRLRRLGRLANPFPLIQLPYHRLMNPWTLGAVLHEVSHNLQSDLDLSRAVPLEIGRALLEGGLPLDVARVWVRWNRETFADLSGLLLGGPSVVASLMDVVGRDPATVLAFNPDAPHPTPYVRTLLSCELLRRMGFPKEADDFARAWTQLYPDPSRGTIPLLMLRRLPAIVRIVVDAVCYHPYDSLGRKSLASVVRFGPKELVMQEEAATRLASGTDPGVIPERFLIGASRIALERGFASPDIVARHFYTELARR